MRKYKKAVGALVTPVVTWLALKVGLDADSEVVASVTALLTAAVVGYLTNED